MVNSMFGGNLDPYEKSLNYEYPYHPSGNPKQIDKKDIENLTLADYGWTPEAIKNHYMFGVTVQNPDTGQPMDDSFYNHVLEIAIDKAEKALDIIILPDIKKEMRDYYETEFNSYMFVHAFNKPILQVEKLQLGFNGRTIYDYPANWWKVSHVGGHVQLFPTALMQTGQSLAYDAVFNGYPQLAGVYPPSGANFAPQMIQLEYVAGMLPRKRAGVTKPWEVPPSLEQLVIKYALKEIYQVWGNLIIGAGIANKSLEVDGISETIGTTQSAMYGGASAQIIQIDADIKELLSGLRSYYGQNMVGI
ncbi:putative tail protein [Staphylococcus phage Twort]|uniref:Tail protein n=2 Tax=Staphylococcus phage Twort (strain DSM 17442 / HER 48) TaxID=2908167 RepID=A0A6H0X5A1_BPTWO|nr:tail fiber protein [Staphylococcus phage Twort]AAX92328.1 ORF032 [Staphylococcus phage Twort]QIW89098.1 putative tail protein [Staphylococcus phage Twort]